MDYYTVDKFNRGFKTGTDVINKDVEFDNINKVINGIDDRLKSIELLGTYYSVTKNYFSRL